MISFKKLVSTAVIVETENVDTDQIIPARFLKTTKKEGLGEYLFYNWRYDEKGRFRNHQLNSAKAKESKILFAGNNFGIGSSREHAVWSLLDYGFRVIISSSFGDIFHNNALKNGLLCLSVTKDQLLKKRKIIKNNPDQKIMVDLVLQKVVIGKNFTVNFEIDSFRRMCLINGVDEIGYLLSHEEKIREYEKKYCCSCR